MLTIYNYYASISACINGHIQIVQELLLHLEINVTLEDQWGETALSLANDFGHTKIVEILQKYHDQNRQVTSIKVK